MAFWGDDGEQGFLPEVSNGERFDFVADYNPYFLTKKTSLFIALTNKRFSIKYILLIADYNQVPASLKPFSRNKLRQASATALS